MAGRRRVALVASSFEPHTGGVESHVRHVARVLAARGTPVEVWTVDRGEHLGTRRVDGVLVRYLPTPQPSSRPGDVARFALAAPGAALAWGRAFRSFRPDVLHVQCFGPNGAYALGLRTLTRTPLVVSSHGETFADDYAVFEHSRLLRSALERSIGVAGAVTGCSRVVADDLVRFGAEDAVVVPNGVDLTGHDPKSSTESGTRAAPPAGAGPAEPVVVAVGRIEHVKGFDLLVDAFAASPLRERARLVVVGDGSEAGALRRRVTSAGLQDRVDLPGRLDPAEVAARLAAADVVVVPSRADAAPLVVLEAWRSGRPLVATVRGGPPEIVTDGVDGVLVDPQDTTALAGAVLGLLDDPARAARIGAAGRRRVEDFTWERVVDRYEGLYAGLGAAGGAGGATSSSGG
ncbi:glycosyltransferase family 4 protein [Cellulosimicrobium protaetiae]|uniref:D-inositol 3-phosphate glycosyltransferase n=1 Tax=Cellulosimicrobium protaetiae TaxID=2587808 RepID=A0A6M5UCP5_9MICO|nr:glycosyltransferase family 4 protein [Cellulosimicrobium protaetiae]QJW35990.1 glycosyltransferase family 4 protein [Cellulosimicrobium protaetiae]